MLQNSCWTHSSTRDGDANRIIDGKRLPTPCLKGIDMEFADSRCTESDLTLIGNGLEDQANNDLLFCSWPELQNFEDVDDMFRSCDSTFGLEMGSWYPSSNIIEGTTDALTSSFDFPSCSPCGRSSNDSEVNESQKELTLTSCKKDSLDIVPDNHHMETEPEMHACISPLKHLKSSKETRRDDSPENISFIQFDKLSESAESNHMLNSQNNLTPEDHQQQKINCQPCVQTSVPTMEPKTTSNPLTQNLSGSSCLTKSEVNVLPTISPKVSSHASNRNQSGESSHDVSSRKPYSENKKKRKSHERRSSRPTEKSKLLIQSADSDLRYIKRPIPGRKNEAEGQTGVDGTDIGFPGERGSTTIPENSCMSSVSDEVSVDGSSLKQLQHVMVQLDTKTRLCIRDSLYRLARSAAHRHHCVNYGSVQGDDKDAAGALLSDGTNKSIGFIDIETDTNPIDRSIAHLLFHRPSDPSSAPTPALVDNVAMKSKTMVEPPNLLTGEKPVCREQGRERDCRLVSFFDAFGFSLVYSYMFFMEYPGWLYGWTEPLRQHQISVGGRRSEVPSSNEMFKHTTLCIGTDLTLIRPCFRRSL